MSTQSKKAPQDARTNDMADSGISKGFLQGKSDSTNEQQLGIDLNSRAQPKDPGKKYGPQTMEYMVA
jgi:hypothetical protein